MSAQPYCSINAKARTGYVIVSSQIPEADVLRSTNDWYRLNQKGKIAGRKEIVMFIAVALAAAAAGPWADA